MFEDLTQRRKEVLQYIAQFMEENAFAPSFREIGSACNISSTSTVSGDVHALIKKGYLSMDSTAYRSLRVADVVREAFTLRESSKAPSDREDVYEIPVFGNVAAGAPIYADDYIEDTIPLPSSFFPNDNREYFVLKIHGDSMIEAGIFDGDHVICRKQDTARPGEQVVALLEDSATVKTYLPHADHIELHPENSSMEPIRVREVTILGVVCGLYRLY